MDIRPGDWKNIHASNRHFRPAKEVFHVRIFFHSSSGCFGIWTHWRMLEYTVKKFKVEKSGSFKPEVRNIKPFLVFLNRI